MSQIYFKRCDRCGRLSDAAITPVPPGWQSLSDNIYGTLAVIDICPACQEEMGMRGMLTQRLRARAIAELRDKVPSLEEPIVNGVTLAELEARIGAGEFDDAFALGDGINLAELGEQPVIDAELVE